MWFNPAVTRAPLPICFNSLSAFICCSTPGPSPPSPCPALPEGQRGTLGGAEPEGWSCCRKGLWASSTRMERPRTSLFPRVLGAVQGQGIPNHAWIVQGSLGSSSAGDPGSAHSHFVTGATEAAGMCLTKVKTQPGQLRWVFLDKKKKKQKGL